jgi:hypothetical protein
MVRWVQDLEKSDSIQAMTLSDALTEEVKQINNTATKVITITSASKLPQELIYDINKAKPNGVRVSEYKFDFDLGSVLISGEANNRQDLVAFKQNLEARKNFSKVSIPVSSLEKETNLDFEATFVYLPVVSKKPVKIKLK